MAARKGRCFRDVPRRPVNTAGKVGCVQFGHGMEVHGRLVKLLFGKAGYGLERYDRRGKVRLCKAQPVVETHGQAGVESPGQVMFVRARHGLLRQVMAG